MKLKAGPIPRKPRKVFKRLVVQIEPKIYARAVELGIDLHALTRMRINEAITALEAQEMKER